MNHLERELRDVLDERSRDARAGQASAPKVLRRARRRQAATALATVAMVTVVVAGSIAALSVGLQANRDREPVITTTGSNETRTSTVYGVSITYPADWYLVRLSDELEKKRSLFQLTNFDPALDNDWFCPIAGGSIPDDGVVLYVEDRSELPRPAGRLPEWPVGLIPSDGLTGRACDGDRMARWRAGDGTYAATLLGQGPAYERLLEAFGSMTFGEPAGDRYQIGVGPQYVLASGTWWTLLGVPPATSSADGAGSPSDGEEPAPPLMDETPWIALETDREGVGGSIGDIHPDDLASGLTTAFAQDASIAWGAVRKEIARVVAKGGDGRTVEGEIVSLPPSFGASYDAFVVEMPDPHDTIVAALGEDGDEVGRDVFETGSDVVQDCAPTDDDPTRHTLPLPTTQTAQSWLRNALAAAKTLYADCESYEPVSPGSLAAIEPSLNYDTASIASAGTVSIRDVASDHVLFVTADNEGNAWCIADDAASETTMYGNVDAAKSEGCTGGWE
jgi:hypothetical protein